MSIQASEILWRYPQERSDAASNGGRMTATEIADNTKNSIWPDVPQSERVAGSIKYRKAFIHIANDADIELIQPRIFVETATPGDDTITLFSGTQIDTQATLNESGGLYGSGWLNTDTNIGVDANSIDVRTEDAALDIFRDGMLIRVSDKDTVDSLGNTQYVTIDAAGVTYAADIATITFTPALTADFVASSTRVASVIQPGNITASATGPVITSTLGVYTGSAVADNIGSIEQSWTVTFTSATAFDIVGDTVGAAGSGNTSGDAIPSNPDYVKPYFTLPFAGFSGTWASGDTIAFSTSPASTPIWYKRQVPAGANSLSGDAVIVAIDGESA